MQDSQKAPYSIDIQ